MLGCWESIWRLGYLCVPGMRVMCLWDLAVGCPYRHRQLPEFVRTLCCDFLV